MIHDEFQHHRRSIRLEGYDYAQVGAYFVTICAFHRENLFGEVENGEVKLNPFGKVVQRHWGDLSDHFPTLSLDAFVIMPNHVHGILVLDGTRAGHRPAPTLADIVRGFKTFSAREINQMRRMSDSPVWQRNYYDHIIRNETALERIRCYIAENPQQWATDSENLTRERR